jgi:hypothetical protein
MAEIDYSRLDSIIASIGKEEEKLMCNNTRYLYDVTVVAEATGLILFDRKVVASCEDAAAHTGLAEVFRATDFSAEDVHVFTEEIGSYTID